MYCPSCGDEIPDDAKFCEHCGTDIAAGGGEASNTASRTGADRASGGDGNAGTAAGTPSTGAAAEPTGSEVSHGLEPNVAGALAYFLGVVTGVVFLLIEEDDQFVRFHAAQSTVVFGGLIVIMIVMSLFTTFLGFGGFAFGLIGFLLSILSFVVWVGALILWVFLMAKAYQGETPRIPVAAGIADDLV